MLLQLLQFLLPLPEEKSEKRGDDRYWWGGYLIRVFRDENGFGWQVYRDDKFKYQDGKFVSLIDSGFSETRGSANFHAQNYIGEYLIPMEEREEINETANP